MATVIDLAAYRTQREELDYPTEREMRAREDERLKKARELGLEPFELDDEEYSDEE